MRLIEERNKHENDLTITVCADMNDADYRERKSTMFYYRGIEKKDEYFIRILNMLMNKENREKTIEIISSSRYGIDDFLEDLIDFLPRDSNDYSMEVAWINLTSPSGNNLQIEETEEEKNQTIEKLYELMLMNHYLIKDISDYKCVNEELSYLQLSCNLILNAITVSEDDEETLKRINEIIKDSEDDGFGEGEDELADLEFIKKILINECDEDKLDLIQYTIKNREDLNFSIFN